MRLRKVVESLWEISPAAGLRGKPAKTKGNSQELPQRLAGDCLKCIGSLLTLGYI
jgi:hypothetical protein